MNISLLIEAMKYQLENPRKAVVNPESSFVVQTLLDHGEASLAQDYWNWVCSLNKDPNKFGTEVLELQNRLKQIDDKFTIPSWGTYGT